MSASRSLLVVFAVFSLVLALTVPASATGVADPTTSFVDDYGDASVLSLYSPDRYNPGHVPPYAPTLTTATVDGRSVAAFGVDGDGPVSGDPDSFYRFQGFQRTTDGTTAGVFGNGPGTCMTTTFRLGDDFATTDQFASFWATTNNATADARSWPIAGVRGYADGTPDELWFWTSSDTTAIPAGWTTMPTPTGFDPAAWHDLTYVLTPNANVWYLDGEFAWADAAAYVSDQSTIDYQIFNFENFGQDYETYVDAFDVGSCTTDDSSVVRPGDFDDWYPALDNTGVGGATTEYTGPGSLGAGAWVMDTGSGTGAGSGGKGWLYSTALDGIRLAELTELQYSTFVSSSSAATNRAPYLNLQVDWDGDGSRDTAISWSPPSGSVAADTWQQWDALTDGWAYHTAFGSLTSPQGEYEPLGYYLDQYPNATIVTWNGHTPGTAMASGDSTGGSWANFEGAVDQFIYGVANDDRVTVDFEPPFVDVSDAAASQSAPHTDVMVDVPVDLSGPNASLLTTDPFPWPLVGTGVSVDWEARDGSDVIDSGTVTVPGGDTSATFPLTIPAERITLGATEAFDFDISAPVNGIIRTAEATVDIDGWEPASETTTIVRPGDFDARVDNTAVGGATTRNGGASGDGAWVMDTGDGVGSGNGGKAYVYTNVLAGTALSDLTEVGYSTFIDPSSGGNPGVAPSINLQIDLDGDGNRDSTFVWEPIYGTQGSATPGAWQAWSARDDDGWWYTSAFGTLTNPGGEYEPLSVYLAQYPNAAIVNWGPTPGFGIITGSSDGGAWAGFVGSVDAVHTIVGSGDRQIADIEPTFVTTADTAGTQADVGDDVTVDVSIDLVASNSSRVNPLLISRSGTDVMVDWAIADGGTVIDSGTATVVAPGTGVTLPITVPAGRITEGTVNTYTVTLSSPDNSVLGVPSTGTITINGADTGEAPANLLWPSIAGSNGVAEGLAGLPGSWSGTPTIAYAYQWQRCDAGGSACVDLPGATGSSYTTTFDDVASTLRFEVTASNAYGVTTAASAPFGPVYPLETTALVDPTTGLWHYYDRFGIQVDAFYYGVPGDYPIVGDWDGDGIETPGLYRQSDGFVYLRNSNTQGNADRTFFFGNPGDIPLAGDFDGDGFDTVSIYRPSEGKVYVINELGADGGGLGAADYNYYFGNPGDKPFTGDFNRDGIDSVGLHRESTGLVYFRYTNTQGIADHDFIYGDPGDRLAAGDWTQDGISTPVLFRPSDTTMYFRNTNTQGNADFQFVAGSAPWIPVAGYFGF